MPTFAHHVAVPADHHGRVPLPALPAGRRVVSRQETPESLHRVAGRLAGSLGFDVQQIEALLGGSPGTARR